MQPGKVSPEPLWLVAASPKDTLSDTGDEAGRVLEDQLANGVQICEFRLFLPFLRHLVCVSREYLYTEPLTYYETLLVSQGKAACQFDRGGRRAGRKGDLTHVLTALHH
jgi:hypothetical protein